MIHLATYQQAIYTSFIHLPSALVLKVNPFCAEIEFVQLYSMLFIYIANNVKHVGGSCLLCKSYFEYNTAVIIAPIRFLDSK